MPSGAQNSAMTRRYDGKSYSVFIACPGDCAQLRAVAKKIIQQINDTVSKSISKLVAFDWEIDKVAEFTGPNFQDRVFFDAERIWGKPDCDVLVLVVFSRFGPNTAKEYDYFLSRKNASGQPTRLMCCWYHGALSPSEAREVGTLGAWIDQHRDGWAEIASVRGSIKTTRAYGEALNLQLNKFLDEIP